MVCISYITGGSPIFLNRIIPYAQCVYCLISTGILAFINDDLITENNRAKILVIRYFQQRNNNKRNFNRERDYEFIMNSVPLSRSTKMISNIKPSLCYYFVLRPI